MLLFMGLAVVLVSLIGYGALTQFIVRPLHRISKAIDRVHEGELDARAPAPAPLDKVLGLAGIARRCTQILSAQRCTVSEVLPELDALAGPSAANPVIPHTWAREPRVPAREPERLA